MITDYCVLDFESNGGNNEYNRIIEIGCIRVRNFNLVDEFHSLVNPNTYINILLLQLITSTKIW
jgi:DNA polymerase-3 subunit epsilon